MHKKRTFKQNKVTEHEKIVIYTIEHRLTSYLNPNTSQNRCSNLSSPYFCKKKNRNHDRSLNLCNLSCLYFFKKRIRILMHLRICEICLVEYFLNQRIRNLIPVHLPGMWIRIHFMRIRIRIQQFFRFGSGSIGSSLTKFEEKKS